MNVIALYSRKIQPFYSVEVGVYLYHPPYYNIPRRPLRKLRRFKEYKRGFLVISQVGVFDLDTPTQSHIFHVVFLVIFDFDPW